MIFSVIMRRGKWISLHYPENLLPKEKEIREGIADILKKNGMEIRYLAVEQGKESIPVSLRSRRFMKGEIW